MILAYCNSNYFYYSHLQEGSAKWITVLQRG